MGQRCSIICKCKGKTDDSETMVNSFSSNYDNEISEYNKPKFNKTTFKENTNYKFIYSKHNVLDFKIPGYTNSLIKDNNNNDNLSDNQIKSSFRTNQNKSSNENYVYRYKDIINESNDKNSINDNKINNNVNKINISNNEMYYNNDNNLNNSNVDNYVIDGQINVINNSNDNNIRNSKNLDNKDTNYKLSFNKDINILSESTTINKLNKEKSTSSLLLNNNLDISKYSKSKKSKSKNLHNNNYNLNYIVDNIEDIISEEDLNKLNEIDIIFQSNLSKYNFKIAANYNHNVSYIDRFCIFSKKDIRIFKSKEAFLHLFKPVLILDCSKINYVDIINIPNKKKLHHIAIIYDFSDYLKNPIFKEYFSSSDQSIIFKQKTKENKFYLEHKDFKNFCEHLYIFSSEKSNLISNWLSIFKFCIRINFNSEKHKCENNLIYNSSKSYNNALRKELSNDKDISLNYKSNKNSQFLDNDKDDTYLRDYYKNNDKSIYTNKDNSIIRNVS